MALSNNLKKKVTSLTGPSAAAPAKAPVTGPGSPTVYAPGAPKTLSETLRQSINSKIPGAATAGLNAGDAVPSVIGITENGSFDHLSSPNAPISSTVKKNRKYAEFSPSETTSGYLSRLRDIEDNAPDTFEYDPFKTSDKTNEYYGLLKDTEGNRPDAFASRYEGAVQSILDGILNKKSYNLQDDKNYNLLYNQARESYMNAGNKAMRDAMGAAQAQTGGYGSTAAQIAGSQAYDNYLQGMNDNNAALAQLAYQMWQDENADRYNQLSAVQGLDESDYNRWLNNYRNWQDDRNYYAGQYQNFYNNDWNEYQYGTDMDYNIWRDELNRYMQDRDYYAGQYQAGMDNDMDLYQYDTNLDYQLDRDAISDYDDAFKQALTLAQNGIAIPGQYANRLEPETLAALQGVAAQAAAGTGGSGGSGGGGGRGRSRRKGGSSKKGKNSDFVDPDITVTDAMKMMRSVAATGGVDAARDLGQSLLNSGRIITNDALVDSVSKQMLGELANIKKDMTGNAKEPPSWYGRTMTLNRQTPSSWTGQSLLSDQTIFDKAAEKVKKKTKK